VDIVKVLLKLALFGSQWVMWLLLGLSVLSISAMVERWFFFRTVDRDVDELGDKLTELVKKGTLDEARQFLEQRRSIEASVLERAVQWASGGADALADAIDCEMTKKKRELERGMNLLGTLGNNAPFVGLLGTVIGVIGAFNQLGAGQDKAAMGNVMAGIAEALVATGIGLFVAIPAVVAYNVFQKRVTDVEDNVSAIGKQLGALLRSAPHEVHAAPGKPEALAKFERVGAVEAAAGDPELAS
jgi:biopolymer transport protein ExbB/biopolymer transport protein TolQ